ncbi:hypothetical protein QBC34DRAFT_355942 [Podospora aff. communis PSN243]|uniref:Fe2OG dioxygenase domain-containing protein n=1 Tax=Podospora aff. communis PSN243 TaxID=3040156 RepID=A0AAV9GEU5_9PEZI|nr:hypothetical protein QBC34DRAFT_355942 [Podospora aff. communis PSN243]
MAHSSPDRKRQRRDSPAQSDSDGFQASRHILPTFPARWCAVNALHNNDAPHQASVSWDEIKINCFLSDEERGDVASMRRLVEGTDVEYASKFHPLIFDSSLGSQSREIRSLPFFRMLTKHDSGVLDEYRGWSADKKRILSLGVRDLYLASMKGLLDEEERSILTKLVEIIEEPSVGEFAIVEGMAVSFYPSANFKMIKFIEDIDTKLDPKWRPYFAQILATPRVYAVFVDPMELSFHNFENIVPLDRWMEAKLASESKVSLELVDVEGVEPGRGVWTGKLQGSSISLLKELTDLNLFVAPLNKATRGGERFIFHSTYLSKALTDAIASSDLLSGLSEDRVAPSDFAFVNYVFRCNRFAPGDAKFTAHRDTPYYDAARCQVSKYTLLIYLSFGSNPEGALEVNGTRLTNIDEFTCVIFDQGHEHEGRPFVDTNKVFLRTELVFNDKNLNTNPKIASLFSEACYMTGQSVFDEELASYAHECFERANSLHWAVERDVAEPPVYLYKQYLGFNFLTNGYDYWFAKKKPDEPTLPDCAIIALLDCLNCKITNQGPFRALCRSTTLRETITNTSDAFRLMHSPESTPENTRPPTTLPRLTSKTIQALFKQTSSKPFTKRPNPSWIDSDDDSDPEEGCCPMHCWTTFDAWNSDDVAKEYRACCKFTTNQLLSSPIVFLGEEILLNEKQIEIRGDKILIHHSDPEKEATRFNFAACWGDAAVGAELYVDVDQEIPAPKLLVPPITFHEYEGEGYHLTMDFFRNDWMVKVEDERQVAVPVITNDVSEELAEEFEEDGGGPFWRRVKELAGAEEEELRGGFWGRESDGDETDEEREDEEEGL